MQLGGVIGNTKSSDLEFPACTQDKELKEAFASCSPTVGTFTC